MTSLTTALSIDIFARFNALTSLPIHVTRANFARLLISSPVHILTYPKRRSLSIEKKISKLN